MLNTDIYSFLGTRPVHRNSKMTQLAALFGSAYSSFYWCLFPVEPHINIVPKLHDCQDNLQDRLGKLQLRHRELQEEMKAQKTSRDRTKLKRMFLEYKSIAKDMQVTENTLWMVDRQIALLDRTELDTIVIDTLRSSVNVLNQVQSEDLSLDTVETLTETLQNRMGEIKEMNDSVSSALERGLESDLHNIEEELDDFLFNDVEPVPPPGTLPWANVMHNIPLSADSTTKKSAKQEQTYTADEKCVPDSAVDSIVADDIEVMGLIADG